MSTCLKICGIARTVDLEVCRDLGVDAVGFNFWPGSRRVVTPAHVGEMLHELPGLSGLLKVGVYVDPEPDFVKETFQTLGLDLVQLHGDTPVDVYARLGIPYVWVIRGTVGLETTRIPEPEPRWILLDAAVPGFGGKGIVADWSWAKDAVLHFSGVPVWLAGGVTVENVQRAIETVGPFGLDVASGAEGPEGPPAKDVSRIEALVEACRG